MSCGIDVGGPCHADIDLTGQFKIKLRLLAAFRVLANFLSHAVAWDAGRQRIGTNRAVPKESVLRSPPIFGSLDFDPLPP